MRACAACAERGRLRPRGGCATAGGACERRAPQLRASSPALVRGARRRRAAGELGRGGLGARAQALARGSQRLRRLGALRSRGGRARVRRRRPRAGRAGGTAAAAGAPVRRGAAVAHGAGVLRPALGARGGGLGLLGRPQAPRWAPWSRPGAPRSAARAARLVLELALGASRAGAPRQRPRCISAARRSSSSSRSCSRARRGAAARALGRRGLLGLGQLALRRCSSRSASSRALALARAQAPTEPIDLGAAFALVSARARSSASTRSCCSAYSRCLARRSSCSRCRSPRVRSASSRSRCRASPPRPRAVAAGGSEWVRASGRSPRRPRRGDQRVPRRSRPRAGRGARQAGRPRAPGGARSPSGGSFASAINALQGTAGRRTSRQAPDGVVRAARHADSRAQQRAGTIGTGDDVRERQRDAPATRAPDGAGTTSWRAKPRSRAAGRPRVSASRATRCAAARPSATAASRAR